MFQLHETSRRRICIAAFFGLCVLPTLLVVAWCIAWHLPGHVHARSRELGWQLGLEVSLGGIRHLRPGVVLYEQLELADPETGRTVLRCRLLKAMRKRPAGGQPAEKSTLVLSASRPEIDAAELGQLRQLVDRVMMGRAGVETDLRLAAAEAIISSGSNSQTLSDVTGTLEWLDGGVRAELNFRPAGADVLRPIRLRSGRNCQLRPPVTGFELETHDAQLPCWILAAAFEELELPGPEGRFRGRIWANHRPEGAEGEAAGRFSGIDLHRLVADRFGHELSGLGELTIQRAGFRQGRLEEAAGTLVAGPGVISRSLLTAAVWRLELVEAGGPNEPGGSMPYEQLAFAFLVDSRGLQLRGQCERAAPGTILADSRGRVLGDPLTQPQPLTGLLQALVPATPQTDRLARRLPLPEPLWAPDGQGSASEARGRAGRAVQR